MTLRMHLTSTFQCGVIKYLKNYQIIASKEICMFKLKNDLENNVLKLALHGPQFVFSANLGQFPFGARGKKCLETFDGRLSV